MNIIQTLGNPSQASLDALASGARKIWADMFDIRAEHDMRSDAVRIVLTHGKNRYVQTIDRQVFGKAAPRLAASTNPQDVLMVDIEITQWSIANAVRELAHQLGPVGHIVGRMEAAEEELHRAKMAADRYQRGEARAVHLAETYRTDIDGFWKQPWYKRVWMALTQGGQD